MEDTITKLRMITMRAHEYIDKLHEDILFLSDVQYEPTLSAVVAHLTTLDGIRMSVFVRDEQPDIVQYLVGNRNTEEIFISNSIPLSDLNEYHILDIYRQNILKKVSD